MHNSEPHHMKMSPTERSPSLNLTILRMDENTTDDCEGVEGGGGGGGGGSALADCSVAKPNTPLQFPRRISSSCGRWSQVMPLYQQCAFFTSKETEGLR